MDEVLLKQGAEALAYKTIFLPNLPAVRKHRPNKPYRHPDLDRRLTKHRILAEARLLQKCRKSGINVPALYFLDEARGDLWMEYIDGSSVRDVLLSCSATSAEQYGDMMVAIGRAIGQLHAADVVHGDLTTSNLIWKTQEETKTSEIYVIDLGLGSVSLADEDKAVDLYVLERAFLSTHPDSSALFRIILDTYAESGGKSKAILKRLELVRSRGRKRTMVG